MSGNIENESWAKIRKTGYLWKQGGSYRSWKMRYFILRDFSLEYFKKEGDKTTQGRIDLTTARGIRTRQQCDIEWPDSAKSDRSFGLAVESRTYYFYGEDQTAVNDWMTTIQKLIDKVGKPTKEISNDPERKPEGKMFKAFRGAASKVTKKFAKNQNDDKTEHQCRNGDSEVNIDSFHATKFTKAVTAREEESDSEIEEIYEDTTQDLAKMAKEASDSEVDEIYEDTIVVRDVTAKEASDSEVDEIYEDTIVVGAVTAKEASDSEVDEIYEDTVVVGAVTAKEASDSEVDEIYEDTIVVGDVTAKEASDSEVDEIYEDSPLALDRSNAVIEASDSEVDEIYEDTADYVTEVESDDGEAVDEIYGDL